MSTFAPTLTTITAHSSAGVLVAQSKRGFQSWQKAVAPGVSSVRVRGRGNLLSSVQRGTAVFDFRLNSAGSNASRRCSRTIASSKASPPVVTLARSALGLALVIDLGDSPRSVSFRSKVERGCCPRCSVKLPLAVRDPAKLSPRRSLDLAALFSAGDSAAIRRTQLRSSLN